MTFTAGTTDVDVDVYVAARTTTTTIARPRAYMVYLRERPGGRIEHVGTTMTSAARPTRYDRYGAPPAPLRLCDGDDDDDDNPRRRRTLFNGEESVVDGIRTEMIPGDQRLTWKT